MTLAADDRRGGLMPFDSEVEAVEYVVRRLKPFCRKLTPEADIGGGLRPDLVARFHGMLDMPLAIEVKRFIAGSCKPFPEAVRQAASYAERLKHAAFVAPLAGRGALRFQWNLSPMGSGLLVAGQFSVGGIYFSHERYMDDPVGGLLLAGQQIASLKIGVDGEPAVDWHFNAAHMLKFKHGHGSQSWR
ncbi:MAG: hypothetical protein ACP5QR_16820 [Rhizomicrobium sp.]